MATSTGATTANRDPASISCSAKLIARACMRGQQRGAVKCLLSGGSDLILECYAASPRSLQVAGTTNKPTCAQLQQGSFETSKCMLRRAALRECTRTHRLCHPTHYLHLHLHMVQWSEDELTADRFF